MRAATTTAPTMLNAFLMTLPSDLHDGIVYLKGNVGIEIGARPLDVLTIRSKEEYPGVVLPIGAIHVGDPSGIAGRIFLAVRGKITV